MISTLWSSARLCLFVLITGCFVAGLLMLKQLNKLSIDRVLNFAYHWSMIMVRVLGIKISSEGSAGSNGAIIVMNHRSYIDAVVILSHIKDMAVVKA